MPQAKDAEFFRHAAHVHRAATNTGPRPSQAGNRSRSSIPTTRARAARSTRFPPAPTIMRAGLTEALSRSGPGRRPKRKILAAKLERLKQEQLSPEERWQKEIQENPEQVWPYLNLAEHYRNRSQLDEAEKILGQGLKANPKEPMLLQTYADVQISRMKRAIEKYTQRTQDRPDDMASRAKLDQITKLLSDYEIKEFRRRWPLARKTPTCTTSSVFAWPAPGCTTRPSASSSKPAPAPRSRSRPSIRLGLSFEANGAYKLAERAYLDALKVIEAGDTDELPSLHYRLGRVAEGMGNQRSRRRTLQRGRRQRLLLSRRGPAT